MNDKSTETVLDFTMNVVEVTLIAFGVFLLVVVLAVVVLVGLREAADPDQAAPEDLTEVERQVIDRDDAEPGSARDKSG
jgi:heme/copper-type cytochrome/quinol oxidase subunit 2